MEPPPPPQLHFMYVAVAAFVLLFFVGCGVLLSRKRRRQHGQLWFPEGFKVSEASKKKRREPLGEDSVGLKLVDAAAARGGRGGDGSRPLRAHGPRLARSEGVGRPPEPWPRGEPRSASLSRPLVPRPLKNASDGALMDDSQHEWGDEDLEAKKFRVSRVGSRASPGGPSLPRAPTPP